MYAHTHWGCGGEGRQGLVVRDFWVSAARFTKNGGDGLRGQLSPFAPALPARAAARPLALAPRPHVHRRLERFGPCRSNQPADTVYSGPAVPPPSRVTLRTLMRKYARGEPISMVTAYDYPSAVHVRRWTKCEVFAPAGLARAAISPCAARGVAFHDRQQLQWQMARATVAYSPESNRTPKL